MNENELYKKIIDENVLKKDGPQSLILRCIPLLLVYLALGVTCIFLSFHVDSKTPGLVLGMFGGAFIALFLSQTITLFKISRRYPAIIQIINEDKLNDRIEKNEANQNMEPTVKTPVE